MTAYEADTGKTLWTSPHERGGYQSPEDLLVIGGLVWSAPITSTRDSGVWTGRTSRRVETKRSFPPKVNPYWFHHRCHIAKATDRFLLASRTGIEFVDIENSSWDLNHWAREGVSMESCLAMDWYTLPRTTAPAIPKPNFSVSMPSLRLAPRGNYGRKKENDRLEKGPAYGKTMPRKRSIHPIGQPIGEIPTAAANQTQGCHLNSIRNGKPRLGTEDV